MLTRSRTAARLRTDTEPSSKRIRVEERLDASQSEDVVRKMIAIALTAASGLLELGDYCRLKLVHRGAVDEDAFVAPCIPFALMRLSADFNVASQLSCHPEILDLQNTGLSTPAINAFIRRVFGPGTPRAWTILRLTSFTMMQILSAVGGSPHLRKLVLANVQTPEPGALTASNSLRSVQLLYCTISLPFVLSLLTPSVEELCITNCVVAHADFPSTPNNSIQKLATTHLGVTQVVGLLFELKAVHTLVTDAVLDQDGALAFAAFCRVRGAQITSISLQGYVCDGALALILPHLPNLTRLAFAGPDILTSVQITRLPALTHLACSELAVDAGVLSALATRAAGPLTELTITHTERGFVLNTLLDNADVAIPFVTLKIGSSRLLELMNHPNRSRLIQILDKVRGPERPAIASVIRVLRAMTAQTIHPAPTALRPVRLVGMPSVVHLMPTELYLRTFHAGSAQLIDSLLPDLRRLNVDQISNFGDIVPLLSRLEILVMPLTVNSNMSAFLNIAAFAHRLHGLVLMMQSDLQSLDARAVETIGNMSRFIRTTAVPTFDLRIGRPIPASQVPI